MAATHRLSSMASSSSGYHSDFSSIYDFSSSTVTEIISIPIASRTKSPLNEGKFDFINGFRRISRFFLQQFQRSKSKIFSKQRKIPTKTLCSRGTSMTPIQEKKFEQKTVEDQSCYPYRYLMNRCTSSDFLYSSPSAFKPVEKKIFHRHLLKERSQSIRSSDDSCDLEVAQYLNPKEKSSGSNYYEVFSDNFAFPLRVYFQENLAETLC